MGCFVWPKPGLTVVLSAMKDCMMQRIPLRWAKLYFYGVICLWLWSSCKVGESSWYCYSKRDVGFELHTSWKYLYSVERWMAFISFIICSSSHEMWDASIFFLSWMIIRSVTILIRFRVNPLLPSYGNMKQINFEFFLIALFFVILRFTWRFSP